MIQWSCSVLILISPPTAPLSCGQNIRELHCSLLSSILSNFPVEALDSYPGVAVEQGKAKVDEAQIFRRHLGEISTGVRLHILQDLLEVAGILLLRPGWSLRLLGDPGLHRQPLRSDQEEEVREEDGDVEEVEDQPGQTETLAAPLGGDEEAEVGQEEDTEVDLADQREAVTSQVRQQEEEVVGDTDTGQAHQA